MTERDESRSARRYATEKAYTHAPLATRQTYHDVHAGEYIPDVEGAIERLAGQKAARRRGRR